MFAHLRSSVSAWDGSMFFMRAADWWCYKIPPPIMLVLLILDGKTSPAAVLFAVSVVVLVTALVCNFGYVLNEVFDVEEDARSGRTNIAAAKGTFRLRVVAILCIITSLIIAYFAIGSTAAALTVAALLFPIAYSVPPVRLKQRKWLGVAADAAAAHLYPALLCILAASKYGTAGPALIAAAMIWATLFGMRGILTHQVLDYERDRASGLDTVVQDYGRAAIIRLIYFVLAPAEIVSLLVVLLLSNVGDVFYAITAAYIIYELIKINLKWTIILFSTAPVEYVPFLNNAYYEVWGPLAIVGDTATHSPVLWILLPALIAMFWPRMQTEYNMARDLMRDFAKSIASLRK